MKLLHVTSSYPLVEGGSTAPFMEEMLEALTMRGHDVRAVVPRITGLQEGWRRGVEVIGYTYAPPRLQNWGYGRSLGDGGKVRASAIAVAPIALAAAASTMRRQIERWNPDVVHLHWLIPHGALAPFVPRTPVVLSLHGADARFSLGPLRPIARRSLRRADAVIAASSAILDAVASIEPCARKKMHVIAHGADENRFGKVSRSDARSHLGLDTQQRIVLGLGRLVTKKGFHELIAAANRPELSSAQIYLAGGGPEEARLREQAGAGRADVRFLGELTREAAAHWLAAADVVAIPSIPSGRDVDSGPVVLMEAMASGTPVVATPLGMAQDVIDDGVNGLLVPPGDSVALAKGLAAVLALGPDLGTNARLAFSELGNWSRVARDMEALYSRVLSESA